VRPTFPPPGTAAGPPLSWTFLESSSRRFFHAFFFFIRSAFICSTPFGHHRRERVPCCSPVFRFLFPFFSIPCPFCRFGTDGIFLVSRRCRTPRLTCYAAVGRCFLPSVRDALSTEGEDPLPFGFFPSALRFFGSGPAGDTLGRATRLAVILRVRMSYLLASALPFPFRLESMPFLEKTYVLPAIVVQQPLSPISIIGQSFPLRLP